MSSSKIPISFQFLTFGSYVCGKTKFVVRACHDHFDPSYARIGIDFLFKNLQFDERVIKIIIFDTCGLEGCRTNRRIMYSNMVKKRKTGIFILFDITDRESFKDVIGYHHQLINEWNLGTPFVLVGTKSDLSENRKVSKDEARAFAKYIGTEYREISSKDNVNVEELVRDFVEFMMGWDVEEEQEQQTKEITKAKGESQLKKNDDKKGKDSLFGECFVS